MGNSDTNKVDSKNTHIEDEGASDFDNDLFDEDINLAEERNFGMTKSSEDDEDTVPEDTTEGLGEDEVDEDDAPEFPDLDEPELDIPDEEEEQPSIPNVEEILRQSKKTEPLEEEEIPKQLTAAERLKSMRNPTTAKSDTPPVTPAQKVALNEEKPNEASVKQPSKPQDIKIDPATGIPYVLKKKPDGTVVKVKVKDPNVTGETNVPPPSNQANSKKVQTENNQEPDGKPSKKDAKVVAEKSKKQEVPKEKPEKKVKAPQPTKKTIKKPDKEEEAVEGDEGASKKKPPVFLFIIGGIILLFAIIIIAGKIMGTGSDTDTNPTNPQTTTGNVEEGTDSAIEESETGRKVTAEMTKAAIKLHQVGMFIGTGEGYELPRTPTRAEGFQMMIHLSGRAEECLSGNWTHPFTDVPKWAEKYVGYAYQTGLTLGISDTEFGSDQQITLQQFSTILLRVLGYSEIAGEYSYETAIADGVKYGFLTEQGVAACEAEFIRGDMLIFSEALLNQNPKGKSVPQIQVLVNRGIVPYKDAKNAGFEVDQPPKAEPVNLITIPNIPIVPMEVGEKVQLSVLIDPENATNPDVTWITSNQKVLGITPLGELTAKKGGSAEITAIADGKSFTATVEVTPSATMDNPSWVVDEETGASMDFSGLEAMLGDLMEKMSGVVDILANMDGAPEDFAEVYNKMITGEIGEEEAAYYEELWSPFLEREDVKEAVDTYMNSIFENMDDAEMFASMFGGLFGIDNELSED